MSIRDRSKKGVNFELSGVAAVLFLAAGSGETRCLLKGGATVQETVEPKAARTGPYTARQTGPPVSRTVSYTIWPSSGVGNTETRTTTAFFVTNSYRATLRIA